MSLKAMISLLMFIVILFTYFTFLANADEPLLEVRRLPSNATTTEVLMAITKDANYDNLARPSNPEGGPVTVYCRVYVYFLKPVKAPNLQFKVHMLLQLRWRDHRLKYSHLTGQNEVIGEKWLLEYIWAPHVYFANERDSLIMKGMADKDHLISIMPEGDVLFTTRLKTTTLCRMKQGKFPFDQQKCHLIMDSWRYNTSNLVLEWEGHSPALIPSNNPSLAEYYLVDMLTVNSEDNCCVQHSAVNPHTYYSYSSLVLTFILAREFGYYLMDYYIPSIILVILSWMTFWLEPDSTPTRSLLGASTMLTFILLSSKTNSTTALKLHFKTNDVWFVGCTAFIFLSLVEFAFVNAIHRQELKKVKLKKANSTNILKTALSPQVIRKRRPSSCPASPSEMRRASQKDEGRSNLRKNAVGSRSSNLLTVNDHFQGLDLALGGIPLDELGGAAVRRRRSVLEEDKEEIMSLGLKGGEADGGAEMTTHEIARWIDRRSRIVFPLAYLLFNAFYWTFMFI